MLKNKLIENKTKILGQALDLANSLGVNIYLVGGTVRDIFLMKESMDLDLVIEGNALDFAQDFSKVLGGEIKFHNKFQSATIHIFDLSVDLMTARKEFYPSFGALPEISPGTIVDDLKRRDFTINALALNLKNGKTLDPFGGINDIKNSQLRILHKNSFREDPTRILRAARYLARFKFKLENKTRKELIQAKGFLTKVSANRLKNEFIKIINEKGSLKALQLLESWGALTYLLPGIKLNGVNKRFIEGIKNNTKSNGLNQQTWLIILMTLYWQASKDLQNLLGVRFDFTRKERLCLEWLVKNRSLLRRLTKSNTKISFLNLHRLLYNTPLEIEVFLLVLLGEKRNLYLSEIKMARQRIKLPLNGQDLLELGVPVGQVIGQILEALEEQVLLGKITSRDAAFKWLKTKLNKGIFY